MNFRMRKTAPLILIFILLFSEGFSWGEENIDLLTENLREMAAKGDGEAAFALGLRYEFGNGVKRDPREAWYWFSLAGKKNITGSWLYLGMKYLAGNGVKQDRSQAKQYLQKAALHGWPMAQSLLAGLYLEENRPIEAAVWLQIAAEKGYPGALAQLNELRQTHPLEQDVVSRRLEGILRLMNRKGPLPRNHQAGDGPLPAP
ncbi:tetratricopeptide repeat protein [Desulfolithobacter sp.]